jgi:hypothetical protein
MFVPLPEALCEEAGGFLCLGPNCVSGIRTQLTFQYE